ncbi:DUF2130 domain-containing protein [Tardiphaga sp. OK245]|uniref:DUF2130 domain-containing protein n=1 Tax=Tardiphaga sp. OK245 TaxID=1855306 RepID=UPI0008A7BA00|nr:DUF2130 domain-containing protein [Tardiphaga sp. OK245]SEH40154.1 hypothetical protein SAMN05216367_0022 [Tardiphaga sp. OK245]
MTEPTIICPNCKTEIKLTESLAAPLLDATKAIYEKKLSQKELEVAKRESSVQEQLHSIEEAKSSINDEISARLKGERERISAEEAKKAKLLIATDFEQKAKEVTELQQLLEERNSKLAEAQKAQADLLRKQRELDDAKREVELTVEKRVQESLIQVRDKAKQEAEEGLKLKVAEREEQIASMQRQIEELKRRSEQGSQQLQGEAQELELEATLRAKFPGDIIQPVPKGEFGGDVLHRIVGPLGECGTILWETKRTKNWSDAWLVKLRDDQRTAKAEIALLISQALPKDVIGFDLIDGVWVAETRSAIPVAIALRQSLISLAAARQSREGQQTKMELVYEYLTGPRFRHRVEAIVEKFSDMQADLDRERKTMTRLWAKRDAQIRGVIESTVGMYGDLQGIAGQTFQEIDGLDMQLLNSPTTEEKE